MAFITFNSGYKLIPEGETVFKITESIYDFETKKLELHLQTKEGQTHREYFDLNSKKQYGRMLALSDNCGFDTKSAGIDHEDFIGRYVGANVYHEEWNGNTKAKLGLFFKADGFGGVADETEPFAEGEDMDDILGGL